MTATVHYDILEVLSAEMDLRPGPDPSVAVLTSIGTTAMPRLISSLIFQYNTTTIVFPQCSIEHSDIRIAKDDEKGFFQKWRILDRRWKWKYAYISGVYNKRLPNGDFDVQYNASGNPVNSSDNVMNARELAALLLQALGETVFDVSDVPTNVFPTFEWDYHNPAQELQKLCDMVACKIILGIDNIVRVVTIGIPQPDPPDSATCDRFLWPKGNIPAFIRVVGSPTVVQCPYRTLGVGMDTDGLVDKVPELSYWVEADNAQNPLAWYFLKPEERQYAFHTAYRMWKPYRVGVDGGSWPALNQDGSAVAFTDLQQILPLFDHLIETSIHVPIRTGDAMIGLDGHKRPREPYLLFGRSDYASHDPDSGGVGVAWPWETECWVPMRVDSKNGTVITDVQLLHEDHDNGPIVVLAHNVRDLNTGLLVRFTKDIQVPGNGSGVEIVREDSLQRQVIYSLDGDSLTYTTNDDDLNARADAILNQYVAKYNYAMRDMEYPGFLPYSLTSSIDRVRWTMMYNQPAMTKVTYTPILTV